MRGRRRRLARHAESIGCDTLVTFEPENLFYLTGFWGEGVGVLDHSGDVTIIAPELEARRAEKESDGASVVVSDRGNAVPELARMMRGARPCADCQSYTAWRAVKKSIPRMKNSSGPFCASRMVKDEAEISTLKKASRLIDELFGLCSESITRGQSESELQAILMGRAARRGMFDTGYRSTLNPLIIAAGPNGALPHAQVTGRRFADGDLIVVDLTLRYRGYVSDSTRTFGLGRVADRARRAYDIVKESQQLGLDAVRPRAACKSVDRACRSHIEASGYGAYFVHSTGHGIGLDVHEQPAVSQNGSTRLAKNMAITVEPGIYVPGRFGVRIEDSLIVDSRPAVMHRFTKDLLIL